MCVHVCVCVCEHDMYTVCLQAHVYSNSMHIQMCTHAHAHIHAHTHTHLSFFEEPVESLHTIREPSVYVCSSLW